jgi:cell division septal protein FtsQ
MKRRVALLAVVLGTVVLAYVLLPLGLRQIDFFRVRQVELVGVRYLAPERVLAGLGLPSDLNLFDPLGDLEQRAESVPGIVRATAARRLPATLRITVVEELPVAFARGGGGLIPLDGAGHPLPYDAAATGFDLPIVERPDSVLTRILTLVRRADATLFEQVDAARRGRDESVILEVGTRRVLLGSGAVEDDIRAVRAVRLHLTQQEIPFRELDARFEGWVVVRRGRA